MRVTRALLKIVPDNWDFAVLVIEIAEVFNLLFLQKCQMKKDCCFLKKSMAGKPDSESHSFHSKSQTLNTNPRFFSYKGMIYAALILYIHFVWVKPQKHLFGVSIMKMDF